MPIKTRSSVTVGVKFVRIRLLAGSLVRLDGSDTVLEKFLQRIIFTQRQVKSRNDEEHK